MRRTPRWTLLALLVAGCGDAASAGDGSAPALPPSDAAFTDSLSPAAASPDGATQDARPFDAELRAPDADAFDANASDADTFDADTSDAASAGDGSAALLPYCERQPSGHVVDLHVHVSLHPGQLGRAQFESRIRQLSAEAVRLNLTANAILFDNEAPWFAALPAADRRNVVMTGVVRPQVEIVTGGVRQGHGDPLSVIDRFADLGARAIKFLDKHAGLAGMGPGEHMLQCDDMATWYEPGHTMGPPISQPWCDNTAPPFPPPYNEGNRCETPGEPVFCLGYDDDSHPLGPPGELSPTHPGATWLDYFRRTAERGLIAIVHGDERYADPNTGRAHQGLESLVDAVAAVRATYPHFSLVMLHGPHGANGLLRKAPQLLAQPGLYFDLGGWPGRHADCYLHFTTGTPERCRVEGLAGAAAVIERFEWMLRNGGPPGPTSMYDHRDIHRRFVFGSDVIVRDGARPILRAEAQHALQRATFTRPGGPYAASSESALFCERAASLLGL